MTKFLIFTKPNSAESNMLSKLLQRVGADYEVRVLSSVLEQNEKIIQFNLCPLPFVVKTTGEFIGGLEELRKWFNIPDHHEETGTNLRMDIQKLSEFAEIPYRGSEKAAGYDLSMVEASYEIDGEYRSEFTLLSGRRAFFKTGLKIELPRGHYARIAPRSGLAVKHGIDVLAGVIDEDYRGEWVVILQNLGASAVRFTTGDRVAQFILERYYTASPLLVSSLGSTQRDEGGFGSTG